MSVQPNVLCQVTACGGLAAHRSSAWQLASRPQSLLQANPLPATEGCIILLTRDPTGLYRGVALHSEPARATLTRLRMQSWKWQLVGRRAENVADPTNGGRNGQLNAHVQEAHEGHHPTEDTELDLPTFSHSSHFSYVFFFSFSMPQWRGSLWHCMRE